MKARHSPGPWTPHNRMVLGRAFDGSSCAIVERVRGGSPGEAEANAVLIAAAPEMYEALVEAYSWIAAHGDSLPASAVRLAGTLQAAIARAEGAEVPA